MTASVPSPVSPDLTRMLTEFSQAGQAYLAWKRGDSEGLTFKQAGERFVIARTAIEEYVARLEADAENAYQELQLSKERLIVAHEAELARLTALPTTEFDEGDLWQIDQAILDAVQLPRSDVQIKALHRIYAKMQSRAALPTLTAEDVSTLRSMGDSPMFREGIDWQVAYLYGLADRIEASLAALPGRDE